MEQPIININHLHKVYQLYDKPSDRMKEALSITRKNYHRDHFALRDVSFQVQRGESIGIIGTNGSGKSTLLKIITGVLNPTSGEVQVQGKIAALLELGAGFNPEYTGIENIYLNGTMMGYTEQQMKEKVQPIIDFADIGEFINQPVKTYSSGMFARLAFAVSINVEPEILIVDEALSVGDTRFQVKCIDKMKELKDRGTTILFVSHATEQVKRFCTKALWLKNGEVVTMGEASKIVDVYENYMRFGDFSNIEELTQAALEEEKESSKDEEDLKAASLDTEEQPEDTASSEEFDENSAFILPKDKGVMAAIRRVRLNKNIFSTFDALEVEVIYEIYEETIDGFLLGAAIYSADRKDYIFGPNTYLDKAQVPAGQGRHKVTYMIPKLPLIQGAYVIDVGIFNNEGIVNFDYKMSAAGFSVSNTYFSEGTVYMEHSWKVEK